MLQRALEPDVDAALQFLQRWAQHGPWVLTALDPDRGFIRTKGFGPSSLADCRQWIRYWQTCESPRNIYFQVNPDRRPLDEIDKKSRKEHIAAVVALHADIDAYKDGEDLEAGRQRVLKALTDELPPGMPGPPSVINSSGNGFNALWRLREPIVLSGQDDIEVVEARNRWLAKVVGGDSVFDVNRIMRLPGSVNYPNAAKRARGLVPVLSQLVLYEDERFYGLEQFLAAAKRDHDGQVSSGDSIVIEGVEDDEIPAGRLREIHQDGRVEGVTLLDDDSGSAWAFRLAIGLARLGWSEGRVAGALLTSAWLLGKDESVDVERQARRAAARAAALVASWSEETRLRFDQLDDPQPLDFAPMEPEPLDFNVIGEGDD
jgi:hypothetical protein